MVALINHLLTYLPRVLWPFEMFHNVGSVVGRTLIVNIHTSYADAIILYVID